jgi:hypothetical protein
VGVRLFQNRVFHDFLHGEFGEVGQRHAEHLDALPHLGRQHQPKTLFRAGRKLRTQVHSQ